MTPESELMEAGCHCAEIVRQHTKCVTAVLEKRLDERLNYASPVLGSDQVADAFLAFQRELTEASDNTPLAQALKAYGEAQKQLLVYRRDLETAIREKFVKPANLFLSCEIKNMRQTKANYYSSRRVFDMMLANLKDLEAQARPDPVKIYSAQQELVKAREEFHSLQVHTSWEIEDVNAKVDYVLLDQVRDLMSSQLVYHRKCAKLFDGMAPLLDTLQQESERARRLNREVKAKREAALSASLAKSRNDKFNTFVMLLSHPSLALVRSMLECLDKTQEDEFLARTSRILDTSNLALPLITQEVSQVVREMTDPTTMFRENTTASKLMTAYTKAIGRRYILDLLCEPVRHFTVHAADYEIDQFKVEGSIDVERNAVNLVDACKMLTDQIMGSTTQCPISLRRIAHHLREEVTRKFGATSGLIAVGSFMILRFICPNIVAPTVMGILDAPPRSKELRALLLITKTLQNLANKTKDVSNKEGYMKVTGAFVAEYSEKLFQWFDEFTTFPPSLVEKYEPVATTQEIEENDLPWVAALCRDNFKKLSKMLVGAEDKARPQLLHSQFQKGILILPKVSY
eukprot:TRINITY_DN3176_c0_g1_i2.p1 TRINITY_DN3176_c0_g1~~TRINITY_DN3176_c0_g1_i2.p1  ORF type:complete len:599 (+),score=146.51 TRINITY_DN3176_c0_g1_i2:81-1799(+)